jgi:hypothetical protein
LPGELESCLPLQTTGKLGNHEPKLHEPALRWAWTIRAEVEKPCCALASPLEEQDRNIFNAAATVVVGNGMGCYLLD